MGLLHHEHDNISIGWVVGYLVIKMLLVESDITSSHTHLLWWVRYALFIVSEMLVGQEIVLHIFLFAPCEKLRMSIM